MDRLLKPRKGHPDTFTSVRLVANSTPTKVRVAALIDQHLPFWSRQQTMQLNTRGGGHCRIKNRGRNPNLPSHSAPSRTMMHNVLKILYNFPTANTKVANTKLGMDTSFMPDPSKSRIQHRLDIVFLTLPIQLELSQSLRRKAGFQTLEVRTSLSYTSTEMQRPT
eukprot:3935448-Amphidinium_carterae.1